MAARLYGYLSVPTVMDTTKDIVRVHYGQQARRSYFEGCSNGGREGLMAAQRFPWLFDGIIARAPGYNWTGAMGAFARNTEALAKPGGAINAAKTTTLAKAVLAACDAQDGVADGLVSNPQACQFNPTVLRCPGGADTADSCLSDAQLATVHTWTSPAVFAHGLISNPGFPLSGNEDGGGAWGFWFSGPPFLQSLFANTTIQNYLARDPAATALTFDYGSDVGALLRMAALDDATNPYLHPFLASGGKLILWHGGGDSGLSNRATTDYYQRVVQAVGGRANADHFVRFYNAPGVFHCGSGPGADTTDLLTPLDQWVTHQRAPHTLLAERLDGTTGATVLSRPLCEYPQYPRYNGSGDVNSAASFTCTAP